MTYLYRDHFSRDSLVRYCGGSLSLHTEHLGPTNKLDSRIIHPALAYFRHTLEQTPLVFMQVKAKPDFGPNYLLIDYTRRLLQIRIS